MAARLLGPMAQTIHHWSGIGDARLTKEELLYNFQTDDRFADARKRILASQILIIDEIGMLSEATFEKVELVCRLAKGNLKPFGGLQVSIHVISNLYRFSTRTVQNGFRGQ